jgi:hypothetical protein
VDQSGHLQGLEEAQRFVLNQDVLVVATNTHGGIYYSNRIMKNYQTARNSNIV